MYAAFIASGRQDSRVVLALENCANFQRSKRLDGTSLITTSAVRRDPGEEGVSDASLWIGISSTKRAWAMESSRRGRTDPGGALMEAAGLHFLDGTCGACDGISRESQDLYKGIEKGRVFAFDGVQAAISVIEGGTTAFCHDISSGLFNLGLSTKPRSSWREDLMASLLGTSDSRSQRCPIDSSSSVSSVMTSPSSPWGAVLHITPNRALVQQQHSNGDTEGLSFHFVRRLDGRTPTTAPQTTTEEQIPQSLSVVEDGYTIFRSKSSGVKRLAEVTADKSNNSAPSKRSKRDPNHPKGYISAFNYFVKDKRPGFVQDGPNGQAGRSLQHNNEINKSLGRAWKEATEQEKKVYEEMSMIDKRRYIKEMRDYRPPEGYARTAPRINMPKGCEGLPPEEDLAEGGTSSQCRRPWPAYTHFAHQERKGVLSSGSTQAKTQMSKAFGRRWRGVPAEEAALYDELEDADKERYEREANAQDSASRPTAP